MSLIEESRFSFLYDDVEIAFNKFIEDGILIIFLSIQEFFARYYLIYNSCCKNISNRAIYLAKK